MSNRALFLTAFPILLATVGAAQEAPAVKRLQVNGTELAYIERGQGEPVVLVHGALVDHRIWAGPLQELSRHYRVLAYSRRGYWPNQPPATGAALDVDSHVQDLAEFIRKLKLQPAHVIGHSAGARVAFDLARAHPELVSSVVLAEMGPPAVAESAAAASGVPPFLQQARDAFQNNEDERAVRIIVAAAMGDEEFFDRVAPETRAMLLGNAPAMKAEIRSLAKPPALPRCEALTSVQPEVLVMLGEHSPEMFHVAGEELLKCLADAELVVLPKASHGLYLDNLAGFKDAVLAFLNQNKRAD